jgi:hypothetical protein
MNDLDGARCWKKKVSFRGDHRVSLGRIRLESAQIKIGALFAYT